MFLRKEAVHRGAHDLFFIFDLQQFNSAIIAVGDHQCICIQNKDAIQGRVVDSVHKLFLLHDRLLVVAVDAYDGEGEECSEQQGKQQVAVIQPAEHVCDVNLVMIFLGTDIIAEKQAGEGQQVGKNKLPQIPGKADDEGHDQ